MKAFSLIATAGLLSLVRSLDDNHYAPGPGVESAFKAYLNELYTQAEAPASTTKFTDFFTATGALIVRGTTATGASEILAFKQRLLPVAGNKHWNHIQNATTVDSETAEEKVYKVLGVIDTTYDGGNCSRAYYQTRFRIQKEADGSLNLTPRVHNLRAYDDFDIAPAVTPTNIHCTKLG